MIILASDGITGKNFAKYCKENIKVNKSAFIVTALEDYKEKDFCVNRCVNELLQFSREVEIFDFDKSSPTELLKYDLICISGGNVFYLLNAIKKSNAQEILKEFASNRILIGWSAGACVLGPYLELVYEFEPDDRFGKDFEGLNFCELEIMPHYNSYIYDFENFEERIKEYERKNNRKIVRISDGDGIILNEKDIIFISDNTK